MRLRALGGAVVGLLIATTAQAVVPRQLANRPVADTVTAMPAALIGSKTVRTMPTLTFGSRPTAAWQRFTTAIPGKWRAAWDQATGVPSRIWGSGISVPGANASPAIAEAAARQYLAAHIDLLAPGAAVGDFELVANHSDGDQRSVGFQQRSGGIPVIGGQVSFRFKRDRLFVIGSEALPDVLVPQLKRMPVADLEARARINLQTELALPAAPVRSLGGEVILPLVGDHAVLGYRRAMPYEIDGGVDGRYLAYVDPGNGGVLAVHQQNRYANGTLFYRGVDRNPMKARVDKPAPRAQILIGGAPQTTSGTGAVSWSPDVEQTLTTSVVGDLATIVNKDADSDALATIDLTIAPNGTATWDESATEKTDSQLVAYISTNTAKEYVREHLDPAMPTLDESFTVNVNLPQTCNAFYDGKSINFFIANDKCGNTGRIEDVVFHEFGHHLHSVEIIKGVGAFDGAMSEGAADTLATMITNDSGMGRGFFLTDEPLRELDPPDSEATFPQDVGEIHTTGIIYGGALFDLRKTLFEEYGDTAGRALLGKLFLATLRRSTSIQTALIEVLAADDDDGDLDNGTPNECSIRDAFGRHGLRTATGSLLAPDKLDLNALQTVVRLDMDGLSKGCSGDDIENVTMDWRAVFTPMPVPGLVQMTRISEERFFAQMPLAIDGTVIFKALVHFKDGTTLQLADNFADPYYMVYQGSTIPLYCIDFDAKNPFLDGWTTGTGDDTASPWQYGDAPGLGTSDPPTAFTGSKIVGQVLGGDYNPKQYSFLALPPIDVRQYSDVRLQYRRWLAVEDSEFDKARVTVDGRQVFINRTDNKGQRSSLHHIDREWRFQDISLSGFTFGHTLHVQWDLQTDEGLNLGGWHIDDVCVVANRDSICGDGIKNTFEQCDNGPANADTPNTCRSYCLLPTCGDSIIDDGEECDEGPDGTPTCSAACLVLDPGDDTGCCSGSRGAPGALLLGGIVVLALRRRKCRT